MSKERSILMSTLMVLALQKDSKSQTRRGIEGIPTTAVFQSLPNEKYGTFNWLPEGKHAEEDVLWVLCPYGQRGDVLWVKETFYAYGQWLKNGVTTAGKQQWKFNDLTGTDFQYHYADNPPERVKQGRSEDIGWYKRNSLFCPKKAARYWLEITDVRVERLLEINEADAIAEGVASTLVTTGGSNPKDSYRYQNYLNRHDIEHPMHKWCYSAKYSYETLWKKINGRGSWAVNPWVWVIEFKQTEKPQQMP